MESVHGLQNQTLQEYTSTRRQIPRCAPVKAEKKKQSLVSVSLWCALCVPF